jgi:hypothetical protein
MIFKSFFFFFCSIVFGSTLLSAQNTLETIVESVADDLITEETSMENKEHVLEDLFYYAENPLNINYVSEDQLERLHVLNSFQIKSLHDYIARNGKFLSIYELQYVFGFTERVVKRLKPFVQVSILKENKYTNRSLKVDNLVRYGDNMLLFRTQRRMNEPLGYRKDDEGSRYMGDIYRYYTKYKYSYNDRLKFGFTMEKDPGEEFFQGSNPYGFDFYSFHFLYHGNKIIKTIALGDYQLNFGQGLTLWSGFSFSKSAMAVDAMKTGLGLDDYTSANENNFFRGTALEFEMGEFDATLFYSGKNRDASIAYEDNSKKFFNSFQQSGYHRTPTEIENEGFLNEKIVGGNITFKGSNFETGLTGVQYFYDGNRLLSGTSYKQFQFSGDQLSSIGVNYRYLIGSFYFYGEEAFSNGSFAAVNGVNCEMTSDIALSLLHRYYQKSYFAPYSSAFSENSDNSNEEGFYFGFHFKPFNRLTATFYFDTYRFTWLKYSVDAPSVGHDWLFNISYDFSETANAYFRIKADYQQKNNHQQNIAGLSTVRDHHYRFHFSSDLSSRIRWSNRIELSEYIDDEDHELGWLIYQDIKYGFRNFPLSFTLRYAYFDTDSYNSRIYAYEHDVLYAFSIPAYYSRGFRTYLKLHYNLEVFDLYLKTSLTEYIDKEKIGSGLGEIDNNRKSEIKLQGIFKF